MKILIADDEIAVKEAIELLLDQDICTVDCWLYAPNGMQALELLKQEKPDVLFCDMQMPVMSGEQLMKEIVRQSLHPQIIAVSGYSDFNYVRSTMQASGIDYILKPIDGEELNRAFRQAVTLIGEQKQREIAGKEAALRRADRMAVRWLSGHTQWNDRVQASMEQLGLSGGSLFASVIIMRNSRHVLEDMFSEDEFAFLAAIQQAALDCAGDNARIFMLDEYLYVLLFSNKIRRGAQSIQRQFVFHLKDLYGLEMIVETSGEPQPLETLLPAIEQLKSKLLLYPLNRRGPQKPQKPSGAAQLEAILQFLLKERRLDKLGGVVSNHCEQIFYQPGATLRDFQLLTGEMNQILRHLQHSSAAGRIKTLEPVSLWLFDREQWVDAFKSRLYDLSGDTAPAEISVEAIYRYLQEHFSENISIGTLSERFYQSPQNISKKFKARYGMTIVTALTSIRMEQAKLFLENSQLTVSQISQRTGYVDEGYFSKVFKKESGMTPKQYRKKNQKRQGNHEI